MRLPATRKLDHQAAYPAQFEGGHSGDTCRVLKAALKAWEQRRGIDTIRYGRQYLRAEPKTTRAEISWNSAPEVKRTPKPRKPPKKKRVLLTKEERLARQRAHAAKYRASIQGAKREELLARKRALYHATAQTTRKNQPPALTPEARRERQNERNREYRARIKAGLAPVPPSKTKEKAKEYRERHKANKSIRIA
jgi:hypothetical protein